MKQDKTAVIKGKRFSIEPPAEAEREHKELAKKSKKKNSRGK